MSIKTRPKDTPEIVDAKRGRTGFWLPFITRLNGDWASVEGILTERTIGKNSVSTAANKTGFSAIFSECGDWVRFVVLKRKQKDKK